MRKVNVIARQTGEFYSLFSTPSFIRKRTLECANYAFDTLDSYLENNLITPEQHCIAKNEILVAPHDDAISNIMTKIRHKIDWEN